MPKPLAIVMPASMAAMEAASNDVWISLKRLSIEQLKALRPTGPYVPLIDALIEVRRLMDAPKIEADEFVPR